MHARHLDEVMTIEQSVFPSPWSRSLYAEELSIPDTRIYLVVLEDGHVIGYIGVMLIIDEAHITTIAVANDYQGRAIGKLLLYHGLALVVAWGAKSATLEVRVSNQRAQSLYHQFGFVPAGIRKNYYAEIKEDGLVMWSYDLDGDEFASRLEDISRDLVSRALPLPEEITRGRRR
jgi:ribosomal-protein-alanine N-acetyltransferase